MYRLLSIPIILSFILTSCSSATVSPAKQSITHPTTNLPTSTHTAVLTATTAPAFTATPFQLTNTVDVCIGSTDAGARERFSFEQIIPCLNTPEKVSLFMRMNIKYEGTFDYQICGGNCYYPASLVYQNGADDCDGHAILQCYLLERNGFDAAMLGLSVDTPVGHNICSIHTDGTILVLDNEGMVVGPFQSVTKIARFYIDHDIMLEGGSLLSLKASQITQITIVETAPAVLELNWVVLDY